MNGNMIGATGSASAYGGKAAHARAAAERAAAEAIEDSEDEGPCKGDATSSDSED